MKNFIRCRYLMGVFLWAILFTPLMRHILESTMTLQMLVQMPLLVLAGWWFAQGTSEWIRLKLTPWNYNGINGLLLASFTGLVWMLPIALDASLGNTWVMSAKFLSLPLLIGAPIALSWPSAGFVVRGIVLSELIATLLRVGWLYLISPKRLCSNYLLDDQERLGKYLLGVGFLTILLLAWKLIWGRIDMERPSGAR